MGECQLLLGFGSCGWDGRWGGGVVMDTRRVGLLGAGSSSFHLRAVLAVMATPVGGGGSWSQAVRSRDEGDGSPVLWRFQEAPHILLPLVLTDWDNCPHLSF